MISGAVIEGNGKSSVIVSEGSGGEEVLQRLAVACDVVVTDDAAWTSGRLVFRDASLARVAGEIRRWYGVSLHITDSSLVNRHIFATFNGEPVDQVLLRFAQTADREFVVENDGGQLIGTLALLDLVLTER